jgi:hypothetical protein
MSTLNFNFTTLTGSETAGWNSINTLINSIDSQLNVSNRIIYLGGTTPTSGYTITWDSGNSRWAAGQIGAAAIANNAVELGTKTTGDYVASVAAAGSGEVVVAGSGESAAVTVRLADNTALRGAATVATPPTYSNGATGTVGRVADARYVTDALAYATAGNITLTGDVTLSSGVATIQPTVVTEGKIASNAVTYAKLNADAKTYDVPTSGTGVYFTASGDFTSASLSTASAQNPVVISAASSAIDLSLPNTVGTEGATITVCQTGTGAVTIKPKVGATATINGSTSNTYILGAQYSVVTLICLSNSGSNGTWVITGDYY